MRIIFLGTPKFALPSLEKLIKSDEELLAVITQPDRPKGRGYQISASPVKELALKYNLRIFQPESIRDVNFLNLIKELKPDLGIVVAYGEILSSEFLKVPVFGCINLHPSLLPKYRGAAPINWAIIKGEKITGVTTMFLSEGMDNGDIILQREEKIKDEDTALSLSERLAEIGAELIRQTINLIEEGKSLRIPQEESSATFAPLLKKEDGKINWDSSAWEIKNKVQGLNPWPGAFTYYQNKILKLWQANVVSLELKNYKAGEIVQIVKNSGIIVATGKEFLLIKELQPEGKKRMSADEYIRGHPIKIGEVLG